MSNRTSWERWESLRTQQDPDPIEVLEAVASFQRYFKAIEREAIQAARGQGRTWNEIGNAVGKTRQAVWESSQSSDFERLIKEGRSRRADVRFRIGLDPF
jgi:hypothetical protein